MTELNTIEDVVRILRERPEVLEEVRRLILTDELLEMPARLAKLTRIVEEQGKVQLEQGKVQREHSETLREHTETLQEHTELLQEHTELLREHDNKLDMLIGDMLERRASRLLLPRLSQEFGLRRVRVIYHPSMLQSLDSAFLRDVENAADNSVITDEQERRLKLTDLVMRGIRKDDGANVWIAVEASGTIGERDVERSLESADALRAVFGEAVEAVSIGNRIRPEDLARANEMGAAVVIAELNV